jgi:hypothetical protein
VRAFAGSEAYPVGVSARMRLERLSPNTRVIDRGDAIATIVLGLVKLRVDLVDERGRFHASGWHDRADTQACRHTLSSRGRNAAWSAFSPMPRLVMLVAPCGCGSYPDVY